MRNRLANLSTEMGAEALTFSMAPGGGAWYGPPGRCTSTRYILRFRGMRVVEVQTRQTPALDIRSRSNDDAKEYTGNRATGCGEGSDQLGTRGRARPP
jgi:hypothetical protein